MKIEARMELIPVKACEGLTVGEVNHGLKKVLENVTVYGEIGGHMIEFTTANVEVAHREAAKCSLCGGTGVHRRYLEGRPAHSICSLCDGTGKPK